MRTSTTLCAGVLAASALTACASASPPAAPARGAPQSTAANSGSPVSDPPSCAGQGAGFELSLVSGFVGSPDPVAAAQWFVRHGSVPGFGSPSSVWRVAATRSDDATVVDGSVALHATRLPDRTWAIDSGRHCPT